MAYPFRVGYDARFALGQYRGMGRVLRFSLGQYTQEFFGLCADGETDSELKLVPKGFHFHPLWEQLSLPRRIRELELDLFLAPFNTAPLSLPQSTRLVLVVHDLIFMEPLRRLPLSSSLYQNLGRLYRRLVVPRAIRRASVVITDSEFSKREIVSCFGTAPQFVRVIPVSILKSWFLPAALPLEERGNYILCIAGESPSKNLPRALLGYSRLCALLSHEAPKLVIAGVSMAAQAGFRQIARAAGVEHRVQFASYLPFSDLQELYRQARLVLVPSLLEGFGIPVLEGMASGTPVVCSNATSLPEVAGDAAVFFDPLDPEQMAAGMAEVLEKPARQQDMIARGFLQAQRFHPQLIGCLWEDLWSELAAAK